MPYYIAFDNSHKERARLDENFNELRDYLNEHGFICYNFLEVPITQESLKPFDILDFPLCGFLNNQVNCYGFLIFQLIADLT